MVGAGQKCFVFDDMATMVPSDIEAFTTTGEGEFYRFLQSCAQPDDAYMAWYQPDIKGHEPDFILYAKDAGVITLEVMNWAFADCESRCISAFEKTRSFGIALKLKGKPIYRIA